MNELVGLEEWLAKFHWSAWPSLMVGRLPVDDLDQLEAVIDKIECFETYSDEDGCLGAGDWRKRFLLVADDCWSYGGWVDCATCKSSEQHFEIGQQAAIDLINTYNLPGDIVGLPFFESVITDPWYLEQDCADSWTIQQYLRPLIAPVFIDSLSQGYLFYSG